MKQYLSLWLIAALLLSLAGCVQKDAKPTTPSSQPLPPVKLTVAVPANGVDYENNGFTLWLEEQTGCDLEFLTFQLGGDYRFGFDPLLEAEELPDILWNFQADPEKWAQYGAEGILLDLSAYYNDQEGASKVFWDRLSHLPEAQADAIIQTLTADDGGMYAFPTVTHSMTDTAYQMFINRNWLDTLGLEMPRDTQSLRTVLEAFRDGDPNGNGKKDELPMLGSPLVPSGNIVLWLINMFTTCDPEHPFYADEAGLHHSPFGEDAYRKALIYIHDLIADGLLYPSAFSMRTKELRSLLNPAGGDPVTVGIWAGDPEAVLESEEAIRAYEALPYWGSAIRVDPKLSTDVYISARCPHPDEAWSLLMAMCSEEGALRMRYGVKGVDWTASDEISYIGTRVCVEVTNQTAFTGPGNATWGSLHGTVFLEPETIPQHDPDRTNQEEALVALMTAGYFCFLEAEAASPPSTALGADTSGFIRSAMQDFCCGTGTYCDPRDDGLWTAYLTELFSGDPP